MQTETTSHATHLGTRKGLREFCTVHRESILVHRLASEEEVEAWWPGGAKNPTHDLGAWIRCFANYVAFLDRDSAPRLEQARLAKQKVILEALADQPEVVTLATTEADGTPRTVTVPPKSYVALVEIHRHNALLATLTDQTEQLVRAGAAEDLEVVLRAYEEQSYLQRVVAWIVTTPGVGLPYAEGTDRPELPAELGELHPADFFRIAAAFQRVNALRLAALDMTRNSEARPDFSVFFASLAGSSDLSTAQLMRDRSLAGEVASASERARGYEQAREAAERKTAAGTMANPTQRRRGRRVS